MQGKIIISLCSDLILQKNAKEYYKIWSLKKGSLFNVIYER